MSPSSPTGAGIEEREAGPAGSSRDAGMDLGGERREQEGGSRKGSRCQGDLGFSFEKYYRNMTVSWWM